MQYLRKDEEGRGTGDEIDHGIHRKETPAESQRNQIGSGSTVEEKIPRF
ncbi:hypothetical protein B4110_3706 [Parageobacillus toebii]|uniref:Uncharacterized protein n=1 Tax=Parageobacillus toebii TaxID=153151 RepID=A0A150N0I5_9BACL|nr:hypothetical protein B4110_3706 [Parageobacillus toebii]